MTPCVHAFFASCNFVPANDNASGTRITRAIDAALRAELFLPEKRVADYLLPRASVGRPGYVGLVYADVLEDLGLAPEDFYWATSGLKSRGVLQVRRAREELQVFSYLLDWLRVRGLERELVGGAA